ncbi:MAG TPA: exodeoxyribonuclease I [Methylibium sp.]|uniref:exodeoxyribonuclease I n=1 Tax=Methylibium sp. TaxID=2067992 RepID=UPI002DBAE026|nr:exodeoxyribonuclease I [Methylibium sp.]HEU4459160.1 exodeoxyribonuclease I [Methylibium sp.]
MADLSFFWHDYETFGAHPRRTRPAQFAGVRTDAELNEIDAPVTLYCRPAPDFLPEPEACLLTGITPQICLERGLPEYAFAEAIHEQLARGCTVGVGYNSIRFDDEVTRHLFWRNLIEPYGREWQNECGRWDLLDVARCCHALRPEGVEWPKREDGHPSFKLEHLSAANGLVHTAAHDALSDVRATIALARRIRQAQPRLWDFCLRLRSKHEVAAEFAAAERAATPLLHVSGMYGAERGALALVWPLAPHPTNKNEVIVWDCAQDPELLWSLSAEAIRERLFTRAEDRPEGVERLPIKTVHLNKSPVVIANLRVLSAERAAHWGIDVETSLRHARAAGERAGTLAGLWPEVMRRPPAATPPDVDEDLYGGFVGDADRRVLQRLLALPGAERAASLANRAPLFNDERLDELLFRWRARNFPTTLDAAERARWLAHCHRRLHGGEAGWPTVEQLLERIDGLVEGADERGHAILGDLVDYITEIG